MFTPPFLVNRAPHSVLGVLSPNKMMNGTEPTMRPVQVLGARYVVHLELYPKKTKLKAFVGRLGGYRNDSRSYRVCISSTRSILDSRNVIFIETISCLLPPPSGEPHLRMQCTPLREEQPGDNVGHNYLTDDDVLRDLRKYPSVLDLLPGAFADHIIAGGLLESPEEADLLELISEITTTYIVHGGVCGLPQDDALLGGIQLDG